MSTKFLFQPIRMASYNKFMDSNLVVSNKPIMVELFFISL